MTVAVLCARRDSVYKTLPGTEVFDADRGAWTFGGGMPVIAHPPCAQWSRLRYFAHNHPESKALGPYCVEQVRRWGGVLEHPAASQLFPHCGLPRPGEADRFGGWTVGVRQWDFGHRASKPTLLYVFGIEQRELPAPALRLGAATHVVATTSRKVGGQKKPALGTAEREHTPRELAQWLLLIAAMCGEGLGLSL